VVKGETGFAPFHPHQFVDKRTWLQTCDLRSINMTQEMTKVRKPSNAYNIFILVLTVLSLAVMVVMLLPISQPTLQLLTVYDTAICIIFLIDFFLNLRAAPKKSDYFIRQRGWLDLIGSIPSFGITKYGGLLRLARLSRLARITRLLRGENKKALVKDVLDHRSQYAAFVTILLTILVLTVASVLVLQFESKSPSANITTGFDSLWYSIVTITTVGYGDFYPVTFWGRVTAMFIMFAGVGIIGALASILASLLVGSSAPAEEETAAATPSPSVFEELTAIKAELAVMRQMLERMGAGEGMR
jgi:voltage-gated potassium channel